MVSGLAADLENCADSKRRPLQLAKALGLFKLGFATRQRTHPLLVLCYHGVAKRDEHIWNPELYMPPELFRSRMQIIRNCGYQVLPLPTALEQSTAGKLKQPTIAITFDDGWHDFYSQAWPILREFNYPATVYQTTFYSNYNRPIFDVSIPYLLWSAGGKVLADKDLTGSSQPLRLSSLADIEKAAGTLKSRARQFRYNAEEKDRMLMRLAKSLGIDFASLLRSRTLHLMSPAELAEVSRAGIDIQLHTHTHRMPRDRHHFLKEIERNRFFIEIATAKPAIHFCYPNGWHRPELGEWLRAARVKTATTCDPGAVSAAPDVMYLPRLTDSCRVSHVRFESWLAGVGLLGASCKRWLGAESSLPSQSAAAQAAFRDEAPMEIDAELATVRNRMVRAAGSGG